MNSIPLTGKILFGGDYYPEQWSEYQNIIDEDFDYMKKASVNTLTLGGGPGEYWKKKKRCFWLHAFWWYFWAGLTKRYKNNSVPPSAAVPLWLAQEDPEINIVNEHGNRQVRMMRQNSCLSNAYFRSRVELIDRKLSERLGQHPALVCWHISNEYMTTCFCKNCIDNFHKFL